MLVFGVAYLVISFFAGLHEMWQRVQAKRYVAGVVGSLRGAALHAAVHDHRGHTAGELIARIVGDSARIREGLSGVLVHFSQNALLFTGMSVLLLLVSPTLGLLLVGAGLLSCLIGIAASVWTADIATRHREKESDYARQIQASIGLGRMHRRAESTSDKSHKRDVEATRAISTACLLIHMMMGTVVLVGLQVGVAEVRSGSLAAGELFLFVAYCLTIHYRAVHMGRQMARMGKVLACILRLTELAQHAPRATGTEDQPDTTLHALTRQLRVVGLEVESPDELRLRLEIPDLQIAAGSRVAVIGPPGAGKSTLLRVLAGAQAVRHGTICWDDRVLEGVGVRALSLVTTIVSQQREDRSDRVWRMLHLPGRSSKPTGVAKRYVKRCGAHAVIRALPRRYKSSVSLSRLSEREARALLLAAGGLDTRSVLLVDDPMPGARRDLRRWLKALNELPAGRTTLVAMPDLTPALAINFFDRVVQLNAGRVVFDGTPAEWAQPRPAAASESSSPDAVPAATTTTDDSGAS